jgi:hypothetical protein
MANFDSQNWITDDDVSQLGKVLFDVEVDCILIFLPLGSLPFVSFNILVVGS